MPPRAVAVLGATGGTGRQVVERALAAGHQVTAFVRDAGRLASHDRLRFVTGDILNDADPVGAAVRDQDAVISALGVGQSLKAGGLIARATPAIVAAMEREGVRRLIFVSAFGVGEPREVPLVPRVMQRLLLRDVYADKLAGEEAVRRSGLDWTLVHPVMLTDGPWTGRYRCGERLALHGVPRIARADVADFLLTQLDDTTYLRKTVLVAAARAG